MPKIVEQRRSVQDTTALHRNGTQGKSNSEMKNGFHQKMERASEAGKVVSSEEFLLHYAEHPDFNYEWNNGILEEKPVSTIAQFKLYIWFMQILSCYLEINHFAESALFEFLATMELENKSVKRKPDLLVVRNDNPNPLHDEDMSYKGVCDLCVELLSDSSPSEIERDVTVKKAEYAAAGIREYFILDRTGAHMEFLRLDTDGKYQPIEQDKNGVLHSEVLPGFQFRLDDLYSLPPLNDLVGDLVYKAFVIPRYFELQQFAEAEHERAQQATQQAQQAAQRVQQAAQRVQQAIERAKEAESTAERYAAQLRALGIEPK